MKAENFLNTFIYKFFSENQCEIIEKEQGVLQVQLTEEMDKQLMNRPFYWHYIKNTNQIGEPLSVTFITNTNKRDQKGEWIHFGSPRFQQIIKQLQLTGKYTKLYEQLYSIKQTPLFPWLLLNIKIIYKGIFSREELFSIGLNLVSGKMVTEKMELIKNKSFHEQIPDYCYPMTPIITLESGFNRIMNVFDHYLNSQDHQWAIFSMQKYTEEIKLINNYFKDYDSIKDKDRILTETKKRYQAVVTIQVVNGGLFYLSESHNK